MAWILPTNSVFNLYLFRGLGKWWLINTISPVHSEILIKVVSHYGLALTYEPLTFLTTLQAIRIARNILAILALSVVPSPISYRACEPCL